MSADAPKPEASVDDLQGVLHREMGARDRSVRHSTMRLQPTVLPPPPDESQGGAYGASPDDDIDLDFDDEVSAKRRQLVLAAAGVAIALAGGGAWLLFGRGNELPPVAAPPADHLEDAPSGVEPPEAEAAAEPPAVTPQPPPSSAEFAGSDGPSELVPPSTDGLSPARKVPAVRIIVDGDREIRP